MLHNSCLKTKFNINKICDIFKKCISSSFNACFASFVCEESAAVLQCAQQQLYFVPKSTKYSSLEIM